MEMSSENTSFCSEENSTLSHQIKEAIENGEIFTYYFDRLTPDMLKEARDVLHETDETKSRAFQELRELIKNEANLVCPMDDPFLLMFLRARKFNVKKAFKLIQNFWKFKKAHPEIYNELKDEDKVQSIIDMIVKNYFGFLPYRDREGCIVAFVKIGMWNPDEDPITKCFQAGTAILLHSILNPVTQIMGFRAILDFRGFGWNQMRISKLPAIFMVLQSTIDCFPARYKCIHMISENPLFTAAFKIIYPLLPEKLKTRIQMHGEDVSGLKEYIHPLVLPPEYGGCGEPIDNRYFSHSHINDRDSVTYLLDYGYKETN